MGCYNQTNSWKKNLPKPFSHRKKICQTTDSQAGWVALHILILFSTHLLTLMVRDWTLEQEFWPKPVGTFWCCVWNRSQLQEANWKNCRRVVMLSKGDWLSVNFQGATLILPCESLRWTPRNGRIGKHPECGWKWLLAGSSSVKSSQPFIRGQRSP